MIDFQEQFLIEFLLCVLIYFAVIALDGRILFKLFFSAHDPAIHEFRFGLLW